MISDYLTLIIPGLIGGIVVAAGNIIYYKITSSVENKRTFLKCQITDLLLPLYIHLNRIHSENIDNFNEFRENSDFVKVLLKDEEITNIAAKNVYLASQDLSPLLLEFLHLQYDCKFEPNESYEHLLDNYLELKDTVFKEYEEKKEQYEKSITGRHYFSDFLTYLRSG
jgi:hypothetical protein